MNLLGSKKRLLPFLYSSILEITNLSSGTFIDAFAGTGAVGGMFKEKGFKVKSNDIMGFAYALNYAKIHLSDYPRLFSVKYVTSYNLKTNKELCQDLCDDLSQAYPIDGFFSENYCKYGRHNQIHKRQFFDINNGHLLDRIYLTIESMYNSHILTIEGYWYLKACLIEAADNIANVAVIYESYLKKLKSSAKKPLVVHPIIPIPGEGRVYHVDASFMALENGDILYLDPPYNRRRYDTNYHILEAIATPFMDTDPKNIKGKSGIPTWIKTPSDWNYKNKAYSALEKILSLTSIPYTFLSYNNEGIISIEDIKRLMEKYGKYKQFSTPYPRFKADNNRKYKANETIEYLHCMIKE